MIMKQQEKTNENIMTFTRIRIENKNYTIYFNPLSHTYRLIKSKYNIFSEFTSFKNCSIDQLHLIIEILQEKFSDDGRFFTQRMKPIVYPEQNEYYYNPIVFKPDATLYFY